jgi:DNA-directed RNA polymerase subunit M/transcription elongation factor TFIIS
MERQICQECGSTLIAKNGQWGAEAYCLPCQEKYEDERWGIYEPMMPRKEAVNE